MPLALGACRDREGPSGLGRTIDDQTKVEANTIMPIIKNFGFMWERDKVEWGKKGPGGSASFDGIRAGNKKRRVNFLEQMGIYVLYDKFEQPVQIGQAKVIFKRLQQHRSDHLRNRWSLFSWFGFYSAGARNQLLVRDLAAESTRTLKLGDGLVHRFHRTCPM